MNSFKIGYLDGDTVFYIVSGQKYFYMFQNLASIN